MTSEITPFVLVYGIISIAIMAIGFPIWIYLRTESLKRSIRFLREDVEMAEGEIRQLKKYLLGASDLSRQEDNKDM